VRYELQAGGDDPFKIHNEAERKKPEKLVEEF
jgi:hypothetical protein